MRQGRALLPATIAIVLLVAGIGVIVWQVRHHPGRGLTTTSDPSGAAVVLDTSISPGDLAQMNAVDHNGSQRFSVPTVGLDVPLGAISIANGQLTPPGIGSAYWVRNLGVAPDRAPSGTVFVVIHSVHGSASAPGNRLIDIEGAQSALTVGSDIYAAGRHYVVTRTDVIDKNTLPDRADVWTQTAGRLVVITCLQRANERSTVNNVVIWAQLAG